MCMNKVSIVIPIYNTNIDDFKRCLDSVLNQTFGDFKVYVIDDGSKNELSSEYSELCSIDKRIDYSKIINGGVANARNIGINKATSKYICFIDSDDTVDRDYLKESIYYMEKENVELAIGKLDYVSYIDNQGNNYITILNKDNIKDLNRALDMCPQNTFKYIIKSTFAGKMFLLDVIKNNQILFPIGIKNSEDHLFCNYYANVIESAIFVPKVWYHYFQNSYSFMHSSLESNYIEATLPYWNKVIEMNKEEKDNILKEYRYRILIKDFFKAIRKDIIKRNKSYEKKLDDINNLYNEETLIEIYKNVTYCKNILDDIRIFLFKNKMLKTIYASLYLRYKVKMLLMGKNDNN